ncbi:MAG TPA: exodeoxyribonuclease VII large subunit [Candidatus Eremiobacteraceae bacterium]|nr:exodeoxyribonuclease VII large subunit [Candidatus Eremiobacteraceae bacterium]
MMRGLFETPAISVGELCRRIRRALQQHFPTAVRVVGEVSKCRVVDGNVYFSLKDTQGLIDCVCFRSAAERLRIQLPLADGLAVEIDGRVDIYDRKSAYQLIVEDIVPVGTGALHLEFEMLKERLRREGLFEQQRKRPIPAFIRDVAIVTSASGAALQDFVKTCRRRGAHVRVSLVHAPVQGAAAAPALARAIRAAGRMAVDVVVVARGGGSIEDLWAFNTELVARAIVASAVPVISAVGHETDSTIADFVADLRAATPTAAAEFVAREREALLERIAASEARLGRALVRTTRATRVQLVALLRDLRRAGSNVNSFWTQRLDDLATRFARCDPRRHIVSWKRRALAAETRLPIVQARLLQGRQAAAAAAGAALQGRFVRSALARSNNLGLLEARLATLGPKQTLQRGYAIVYDANGAVLKNVAATRRGDAIGVEMNSGWLAATVNAKRERHEKDSREN